MTDTTKHDDKLIEDVARAIWDCSEDEMTFDDAKAFRDGFGDSAYHFTIEQAQAALAVIGEPKIEDWMMSNPDVRASSERMIKIGKRTTPIEGVPDLPELQHLVSDVKTMFLAFEAELEDHSKHNSACADENDTLREEVSMLENAAKTQSAEIEQLRVALRDQVIGWTELLKLEALPERERWGAQETLRSAKRALKGGAA
ncbi:hypothetical protein [Thalassospira tepidiphila]|uniref:Uncharacterized protein n=2 Tax=Thalassospira tepidiphila TaxID=393657 RepID=A0A853KV65_9PROT|nr:hypothetical protein [Thalassospira tepidiphila]NJB74607.1 hypothetical protein [Thalassospira tepidiphila]OAZ08064.1 hypothetical protein TH4_18595 [Thalassospira tepidiphila MCCC 1A03514]